MLFFFLFNQIIFLFADVLYESIVDENAYETTEYVTSKAKRSTYGEPNAIAPKSVSTKENDPSYVEPNAISTEYCNPNTALNKINFSHYNLPDHSLLQSYKSMREHDDKAFAEEFKVCKIVFDRLSESIFCFFSIELVCTVLFLIFPGVQKFLL